MSGKSGTMLPMMACSSTGQFCHEGSCGWQRRIAPAAPASSATNTGPRQPSINPAPTAPVGGHAHWRTVRPGGQRVENALDETTRFLQLIEAHRDARGHIALAASDLHRRKLRVRLARQVDAQIERLGARAAREPGESQARGELRSDRARAGEPIAHALVLVVDRA